jgi:hypothetical protein
MSASHMLLFPFALYNEKARKIQRKKSVKNFHSTPLSYTHGISRSFLILEKEYLLLFSLLVMFPTPYDITLTSLTLLSIYLDFRNVAFARFFSAVARGQF